MNELISDVSRYNNPVNYAAMKEAGFVALIAKSGGSLNEDKLLMTHAAGAKAVGLYFGNYYWSDPLQDATAQSAHCLKLAKKSGAQFLGVDNEQWWANWDKWLAARFGKIPMADVPRLDPRQIDKTAHTILRNLATIGQLPLLHYSSVGYINSYCQISKTWLDDYCQWLAQYHKTGPNGGDLKKYKITYKQLIESYLPTSEPYYYSELEPPVMWQWTGDRFTLDQSGPADVSSWIDKTVAFVTWVNAEQPVPVEYPYEVKHLKSWVKGLNVRAKPVVPSVILRVLVPTDTIYVEKTPLVNTYWAKLYGEPGYVHSGYIE